MRVHFIAIGGSAMHNLAIALHKKGDQVTGSDDEIFDPSRSRLERHGLLPESIGWETSRITPDIDAVILGMHARADNPELAKAKELGLTIYSYPEFLYEATKNKTRVVIGGSHGKTSITAMILHVLQHQQISCDYMVGAQLAGFDCMVQLDEANQIAVMEGDEYLSSPIDRRPKFHLYQPDIALISGIAWDHINVFPTWDNYVDQFCIFTDCITQNGTLVYCTEDENVKAVGDSARADIAKKPYGTHDHEIRNGDTYLKWNGEEVKLRIFGNHNLQNLNGALHVCLELGVSREGFYEAIATFGGASKRLELVAKNEGSAVYKDFAHSPSKLKATTAAMKEQYPDRELIACMELHTFSSLNREFLQQYDGAMASADRALVYFNPETLKHKRLEALSSADVKAAFGSENVEVLTEADELLDILKSLQWKERNLLMMSSGNFNGVDFKALADQLLA